MDLPWWDNRQYPPDEPRSLLWTVALCLVVFVTLAAVVWLVAT